MLLFFGPKVVDERGEANIDNPDVRPPELRWQSGRLLTARSSVRSRVEAHIFVGPNFVFFWILCWLRGLVLICMTVRTIHHTGGSSAVEQRTVKCASAYAVILWSGVQISPPGCFCAHFFFARHEGRNYGGFGAFRRMRRCVHTIRASIVQG